MDNVYIPLETIQKLDALKVQLASERGITLIIIPHWWDGKEARYSQPLPSYTYTQQGTHPPNGSLRATIHKYRPELLPRGEGDPIPEGLTPEALKASNPKYFVEDIGEPTSACFFLRTPNDPANWYIP